MQFLIKGVILGGTNKVKNIISSIDEENTIILCETQSQQLYSG